MTPDAFQDLVHPFRRELTAHCFRMLGSLAEADAEAQEAMQSVARGLDRREDPSAIRARLYRTATQRCLAVSRGRPGRSMPDQAGDASASAADRLWIDPAPAALWDGEPVSPDACFSARESVQLGFIVALQRLPAGDRAAVILREVAGWSLAEVADLLATSPEAVERALTAARATLDAQEARTGARPVPAALISRYLSAWEAGNLFALVKLLRDDVVITTPPRPTWYRGREALRSFLGPEMEGPGAYRIIPVLGADDIVLAVYRRTGEDVYDAHALQVLRTDGHLITEIHAFLDTSLFTRFAMPDQLADP